MEGIIAMFKSAAYWEGLALTVVIIVAEHVIAHRRRRKDWGLVLRYAGGVLAFLAPFAVWCIEHDQLKALAALSSYIGAAGVTTVVLYLIDGERAARLRGADLRDVGYPDTREE